MRGGVTTKCKSQAIINSQLHNYYTHSKKHLCYISFKQLSVEAQNEVISVLNKHTKIQFSATKDKNGIIYIVIDPQVTDEFTFEAQHKLYEFLYNKEIFTTAELIPHNAPKFVIFGSIHW